MIFRAGDWHAVLTVYPLGTPWTIKAFAFNGSSLWIYLTKVINENKVYLYEKWKTFIHIYLFLTVSSSITMVYLNLPLTNQKYITVLKYFLYSSSVYMVLIGISDILSLIYLTCVLTHLYCFKSIIKLAVFKLFLLISLIKKRFLFASKERKLLSREEHKREAIEYTVSQLVCLKKYCLETPGYIIKTLLTE